MGFMLAVPRRASPWLIRLRIVPTIRATVNDRFGTPSDRQQAQMRDNRDIAETRLEVSVRKSGARLSRITSDALGGVVVAGSAGDNTHRRLRRTPPIPAQ